MHDTAATITIRPAHIGDESALRRLAALDSAEGIPSQPLLVAEVDGTLRVALSLDNGDAIADPFFPSADTVTLLRTHAAVATSRHSGAHRRQRPHLVIN